MDNAFHKWNTTVNAAVDQKSYPLTTKHNLRIDGAALLYAHVKITVIHQDHAGTSIRHHQSVPLYRALHLSFTYT